MASILIVDDEPDIRAVIRFALEGADFRCLEAGHADEARRLLAAEDPDLMLLDWMLPGRSGLELAQQLKQNPKTRALPIIMVSARGEEEDRIKGLDTGADDYIAKPFSPRELVARVNAVLRRTRPDDAADAVEVDGLHLDHGKSSRRIIESPLQNGEAREGLAVQRVGLVGQRAEEITEGDLVEGRDEVVRVVHPGDRARVAGPIRR